MKNLFIIFILLSNLSISAQDLIPYRKGDKWGFANQEKQIVIEPQFDEVGIFRYSSTTWVKIGKKYAFINNEGKLITEIEFDETSNFYFGTARVIKNDSSFCIGLEGKPQNCIVGCDGSYSISNYFNIYKKDGKIGTIFYYNKRISKYSIYTKIDSSETIWDDFIENGQGLAAVSKDGK